MTNRLHNNERPQLQNRRVTEAHFIDVRNPYTDKLIFKYDPVRNVVEHQHRGKAIIIDLNAYAVDIEQVF